MKIQNTMKNNEKQWKTMKNSIKNNGYTGYIKNKQVIQHKEIKNKWKIIIRFKTLCTSKRE